MQRMRNNNLEVMIMGSSCLPQKPGPQHDVSFRLGPRKKKTYWECIKAPVELFSIKFIRSVASLRCGFCDYDIGCSNVPVSTKEEVLSVRPSG